jgi:hypothetical protein
MHNRLYWEIQCVAIGTVMDFVTEVIMEVVRDEDGSLWWLMMVEEVSYGGFGGG